MILEIERAERSNAGFSLFLLFFDLLDLFFDFTDDGGVGQGRFDCLKRREGRSFRFPPESFCNQNAINGGAQKTDKKKLYDQPEKKTFRPALNE